MKISFVTTVLNEEKTIERLLNSLFKQSRVPDEIIIVDGGSEDNTRDIINKLVTDFKKFNKKVTTQIIEKKGNRAVGRNEGIKASSGEIIVLTDAGCILDKDWVKNIVAPFSDSEVDVVAGYYRGVADSAFQKALIPYVLVMEDRVNPKTFLPATRSMSMRRLVWEKAGKFPEKFSHNEDYVFAKNLQKTNVKIYFQRQAIVYWIPRNTFKEAFIMFSRFARGDAEARILRPKVGGIFLRYFVAIVIIDLLVTFKDFRLVLLLLFVFVIYSVWAVLKNFKYVKSISAIYLLPAIQFTSDIAVIYGSIVGFLKKPTV